MHHPVYRGCSWSDHQIWAQSPDATRWCIEPARASPEIKLNARIDYITFTKSWIEKLRDRTQRDPILGNSVPTHSARLATSKETCATCSKMILGLQRWTFYGWWTTSERTKVGDTTQTVSTLSIWRPSLYLQGTGECKTTYVLARNQCWHWGLHKEMPGVHQAVSASQGAFPASRHTRETIEENWHGLLQL